MNTLFCSATFLFLLMNLKKIIFVLITFLSLSAHCQDCRDFPNRFASYSQAISLIKSSKFNINESVNTSKSSWVKSAHYYSCDGRTGFFIIEAKGRKYIHANMPFIIWRQFKRASSFGSFYDHNIKGKYKLYLN